MEWIERVRPQRKSDPKPLLNVSAVPSLHSGFFCVVSLGLNYIFMGQADEEGRGMIAPHHFIMAFKAKNQRAVNMLKNKRCWAFTEDLWSWNPHMGVWCLHICPACPNFLHRPLLRRQRTVEARGTHLVGLSWFLLLFLLLWWASKWHQEQK